MRKLSVCFVCAAVLGVSVAGCGDDQGDDQPTTGSGASSSSGNPSGTGGSGTGADGGSSASTGGTGAGGSPVNNCTPATETDSVSGVLAANQTLTADKVWTLDGLVVVPSGITLTIDPCTVIKGAAGAAAGTLVVEPGGKLMAEGEADKPILFTSMAEPGDREAGDWSGVILEGKAPINVEGGSASIEGLDPGTVAPYGGTDPADSSGSLKYIRIEFSGSKLGPDNEINGLTFGGVGSGTVVEHIMVHRTLDDCFEFFGGTVNAKWLICHGNEDDGFDWDLGYVGKLQFLALQQSLFADDTNGFEADNDEPGTQNTPISNPTIYNATLCGKNMDVDKQQYGMLLRRSTQGAIFNTIVTGFEAGIDVRDANTDVTVQNSIFFGNVVKNIAYAEDGSDDTLNKDDDAAFDEVAYITTTANKNSETDPKIADCFNAAGPDFRPEATLSTDAASPPNDGFFDSAATYIGAFKSDDTWASGAWVDYSAN